MPGPAGVGFPLVPANADEVPAEEGAWVHDGVAFSVCEHAVTAVFWLGAGEADVPITEKLSGNPLVITPPAVIDAVHVTRGVLSGAIGGGSGGTDPLAMEAPSPAAHATPGRCGRRCDLGCGGTMPGAFKMGIVAIGSCPIKTSRQVGSCVNRMR